MSARTLAALAVGAALVAANTPARAGCRRTTDESGSVGADGCPNLGKPLFWKKACVGYALSANASEQLDFPTASGLMAEAFATWSTASCGGAPPGIQFIDQGATPITIADYQQGGPNVNLVVFRDDAWPHEDGAHNVALTTVTFNITTGAIMDADMEFNSADYELTASSDTTAYDFLSIATHEAGHLLGFAHSSDPDSTMWAVYEPGTTFMRDLEPDDAALLCQTYRPDGTRPTGDGVVVADACEPDSNVPCPSSTVAGCSAAPATSDSRGLLSFGAFCALALIGLRHRVRRG